MNATAWFEFELMIYEIATSDGDIQQRAMLPLDRLASLTPQQFPAVLREKLLALKAESRNAPSMSTEQARQFIARIVSFQQSLRYHT